MVRILYCHCVAFPKRRIVGHMGTGNFPHAREGFRYAIRVGYLAASALLLGLGVAALFRATGNRAALIAFMVAVPVVVVLSIPLPWAQARSDRRSTPSQSPTTGAVLPSAVEATEHVRAGVN